jgi:hypothetical protein
LEHALQKLTQNGWGNLSAQEQLSRWRKQQLEDYALQRSPACYVPPKGKKTPQDTQTLGDLMTTDCTWDEHSGRRGLNFDECATAQTTGGVGEPQSTPMQKWQDAAKKVNHLQQASSAFSAASSYVPSSEPRNTSEASSEQLVRAPSPGQLA